VRDSGTAVGGLTPKRLEIVMLMAGRPPATLGVVGSPGIGEPFTRTGDVPWLKGVLPALVREIPRRRSRMRLEPKVPV